MYDYSTTVEMAHDENLTVSNNYAENYGSMFTGLHIMFLLLQETTDIYYVDE